MLFHTQGALVVSGVLMAATSAVATDLSESLAQWSRHHPELWYVQLVDFPYPGMLE
jgi:hypothetical protein